VSIPVALDKLREEITGRGDAAFLISTGPDGPHVVSARFAWRGDLLAAGAGSRTAANVESSSTVCVLWPSSSFDDYSLIVDGAGRVDGDTVLVEPVKAVLHRSSSAAGDGPSCVPVLG
jgi:hypothetical protein